MIRSLVYIAVSFEDARTANVIQTNNMITAFKQNNISVFPYWKYRFRQEKILSYFLNWFLETKIFHYLYLIILPIFVSIKYRKTTENIFYTRSILVGYIINIIVKKPVLIELHTAPRWKLEILLLRNLKKNTKLIYLTDAVREKFESLNIGLKYQVAPDAHDFQILSLNDRAAKILNKNESIKIGYFGKYSEQKGSNILREMVKLNPTWEFYIHTLNDNDLKAENIKENRYLSREEVKSNMIQMDFLLLFVVPTFEKNDISNYTSPLKLFEYASSGGFIIASDVPVLRELEGFNGICFSDNNAKAFGDAIKKIINDVRLQTNLQQGALGLALANTWSTRAKNIAIFASETK